MGGYSSDSNTSDHRRSKKKKKKRSRTSRSPSYSSDDSRYNRPKKGKKKLKRSRSRSREAYLPPRSRGRRSRSPARRSWSKSHRSRSRSRRRSRSRSRYSPHSYSSRKRSRSRSASRRRSSPRQRRSRSRSLSRRESSPRQCRSSSSEMTIKTERLELDSSSSVQKKADGTQQKMAKALKAAAEMDARLRQQGLLSSKDMDLSLTEQQARLKAIEDIDTESFVPTHFVSSKATKLSGANAAIDTDTKHVNAIYGGGPGGSLAGTLKTDSNFASLKNIETLLAPIFFESADTKWERWIDKVNEFRHKNKPFSA